MRAFLDELLPNPAQVAERAYPKLIHCDKTLPAVRGYTNVPIEQRAALGRQPIHDSHVGDRPNAWARRRL